MINFKNLIYLILIFCITGCVGSSSTGIFGTGVTIAMDPRTLGTQIDDSVMDKTLDTKIISMNKSYLLYVNTKVIDGRIFITGKVDTPEEKLKITKVAWEIKGARSVKNDLKIKEDFNFKQSAKDLLITSQMRSALIFNKKIKAVNYNIDTYKKKFCTTKKKKKQSCYSNVCNIFFGFYYIDFLYKSNFAKNTELIFLYT